VRAAGFGAGAIAALVVVCGIGYWWMQRPKPWTDKAISAKFNELDFQVVGEQLNFTFQYTLYNTTDHDYSVPAPGVGVLLRQIPEKDSFDIANDASWDNNLIIPPKQSMNVKFVVPYKLADYNTSAQELYHSKWTPVGTAKSTELPEELLAFVGRRLKDIDGFAFFDYGKKYKVILPKWKEKDFKHP